MSLNRRGRVYLVGAGCGDFDLITLRGRSLLERCDVVVYDSLIDRRLLEFVPEHAEKICVGKRSGLHSETQENINSILVEKALCGYMVVRLKGGDPFVFGRGGEEIIALRSNEIEYAVVPGISSAIAVPELAGIPVTHRCLSRSFHVITGHTADNVLPGNMKAYAKLDGTLVFLMGLKCLDRITEELVKNGKPKDTPIAVISNGAGTAQRILKSTLKNIAADIKKEKPEAPAVIVVGDAVNFDFVKTIPTPLSDFSVTVTGTKRFVNKLSPKLETLGADVKILDYLDIVEYQTNDELEGALSDYGKYGWIVLTSINGAEIFFKRLNKLKIDIRKLSGIKFAVIGSGTASVLEKRGIYPELIPERYTSESLGLALSDVVENGERVLILRAEQGSEVLSEILDKNNILYKDIKIYDVVCSKRQGFKVDTDFIVFASSSGVKAFFDNDFKISSSTGVVCIGEVTAGTLKRYGIDDFKISKTSNIEGIAETILTEAENA